MRKDKDATKRYSAAWAKANRVSKRAAYRRWEAQHPEKAAHKSRVRVCAKRGLTVEEYADLLVKQNGRCALCQSAEPGRKSWCIDHDHETDVVRGLLCWPCNLALGWYEKHLKHRLADVDAYLASSKPKPSLKVVS